MMADDTSMLGHDKDIPSSHLNANLEIVSKWLQVNKLSLNVLNYHYMLFTRERSIPDDIEIKFNDVIISRIKRVKFVGVVMEKN